MNLIREAKEIQTEITHLLLKDDISQLSKKYDELDVIYKLLNNLTNDVKLIRINCQTEIISRLKKIRNEVEILEQENLTINEIHQLQNKTHGMKEVAPGIMLPVISVPNDNFIPDSQLYHIDNTDDFAIRINGTIIRGKINNFDKNWTPGSWLFTREPLQKKNIHMRHIGSADTLAVDIQSATRIELSQRSAQCAHDLLIQLAIDATL